MTASGTKQERIYQAIAAAGASGASADDLADASGIESRTVLQTSLSYVARRRGVSIVSVTVRDWRSGRHTTRYYLRATAPPSAVWALSEALS